MLDGELTLPKFDKKEIYPGVWAIGEPSKVSGTNKLRCLAEINGMLVLVELILKFK
jgi:hypothetical protein